MYLGSEGWCTLLGHVCLKMPVVGVLVVGLAGASYFGTTEYERDIDSGLCKAATEHDPKVEEALEENQELVRRAEATWEDLQSSPQPSEPVLKETFKQIPDCRYSFEEVFEDDELRSELSQIFFYNQIHEHGLEEAEARYRSQDW